LKVRGGLVLNVKRFRGGHVLKVRGGLVLNVKRFRGGLVLKAHRRVYHSTLGLRVMRKRKKVPPRAGHDALEPGGRDRAVVDGHLL